MSVSRFEDLLVWQKALRVSVAVYEATREGAFARDFWPERPDPASGGVDHVEHRRGIRWNSRAEFARFVSIARGSAGEVRAQVYLARELGYLQDEKSKELLGMCEEITRMLVALRKSLEVAVPRH